MFTNRTLMYTLPFLFILLLFLYKFLPEGNFEKTISKSSSSIVSIETKDETKDKTTLSHGTGFIYSFKKHFYIVTNEHVIHGSDTVSFSFNGVNYFPTRVEESDYDSDLAILDIDKPVQHSLSFADSSKIKPGEFAIAIGFPYPFGQSSTLGIISATGKSFDIENRMYSNLIQTDALILSGNSGGPLLNQRGQVIGIVTAASENTNGIGFAIPSNQAKTKINEMINSLVENEK